jgi:hypothetical protein
MPSNAELGKNGGPIESKSSTTSAPDDAGFPSTQFNFDPLVLTLADGTPVYRLDSIVLTIDGSVKTTYTLTWSGTSLASQAVASDGGRPPNWTIQIFDVLGNPLDTWNVGRPDLPCVGSHPNPFQTNGLPDILNNLHMIAKISYEDSYWTTCPQTASHKKASDGMREEYPFTVPAGHYAVFDTNSDLPPSQWSMEIYVILGSTPQTWFTLLGNATNLAQQYNSAPDPIQYSLAAALLPKNNLSATPNYLTSFTATPTSSTTTQFSFPTGESDLFGNPISQTLFMRIVSHP